jgi:hypothetical protein
MPNITENRISQTINAVDEAALNTGAAQVAGVVNTYTIALEPNERNSLFALNEANLVFAFETLQEAQGNLSLLPTALQNLVPEMEKDINLYNQLLQFESLHIAQWAIRIKDTKRLTGHEAYKVGLTIYTMFEALAKAGVPGAQAPYQRLKERFANQGGGAPIIENP